MSAKGSAECLTGNLASLRCGPRARHIYPSLVLVQLRKTHPSLTERLLMGCKESNQTNKQTNKQNVYTLIMKFQKSKFILFTNNISTVNVLKFRTL